MSFNSPVEAVLAGDRIPADLTVLATAESEAYAALVVSSESWWQPEAVVCEKKDGGWEVVSEGSGCTRWFLTEDATDKGVMVAWGPAESGVAVYEVGFRGRTWRVPVENGHYVWLVEGVDEQAIDDPADFTAIY